MLVDIMFPRQGRNLTPAIPVARKRDRIHLNVSFQVECQNWRKSHHFPNQLRTRIRSASVGN